MPHPNVNQGIDIPAQQPGSVEGFYLGDLAEGAVLDIETQHRRYRLVKRSDTRVDLSGHPTICPEPVEVEFEGSVGNKTMSISNQGFIGPGMCLVFRHPLLNQLITTSRILEVHKIS